METDAIDGETLEDDLRIDNGALEVAFAETPDGGCSLRSLSYGATGHAFATGDVGDPLWVWRVTFPASAILRREGGERADDRLVLPDGWGASISNPVSKDVAELFTWNKTEYPSGSMAMQFLAFENAGTGLYLGFEDAAGGPKEFDVGTGTDRDPDRLSAG